MKILLVHLSDIHLKKSTDMIFGRIGAIVDSVKNLDYSVNGIFIAFSGDIAFSGCSEQYDIAETFLHRIIDELSAKLSGSSAKHIPIHPIIVPGNHDCDFDKSDPTRDMVLDGVLGNRTKATHAEVIAKCTEVQNDFFKFRDKCTADNIVAPNDVYNRLFYKYKFVIDGQTIQFICCNTAWLSRKEDKQAERFFPTNILPSEKSSDALTVSVFHHPYNWIEADAKITFKEKIEETSDIILTGHEHHMDQYTQEKYKGETNMYIEGGVLQKDGSDESNFNALIVDLVENKQKFCQLRWDNSKSLYIQSKELVWKEYHTNRIGRKRRFLLNEATKTKIDELGMELVHHDRGNLKLSDVFVFSDLRKLAIGSEVGTKIICAEGIDELVNSERYLLITGDEQSGKTSMAKMLFLNLYKTGKIPIFLEGDKIRIKKDNLNKYLLEVFEEQYVPGLSEAYEQLDVDQRAIIVDDYHKIYLKGHKKREFVSDLTKFAGKVILFAGEVELALTDLNKPEGFADGQIEFDKYYAIQPFGYMRRNILLEKWLNLNEDSNPANPQYGYQLRKISNTVDTLLGTNYLPAYPVYLLCIFQTFEAGTQLDMNVSTYAYYYELLIKNALARGRTTVQYGTVLAYISHLAYRLFQKRKKVFDIETFQGIHSEYESIYDYSLQTDEMLQQLESERILEKVEESYHFKYKYIYYYFVAKYMSDHINDNEEDVQIQIKEIIQKLYVAEYANILLFLAHLSKDKFIIQEMLSAAQKPFSGSKLADFSDDIAFLGEISQLAKNIILEESDTTKNRERALIRKDKQAEEDLVKGVNSMSDDIIEPAQNAIDLGLQIVAALKSLQILGQTLKNFPGEMKGGNKHDIAEACCNLGLRILSAFLNILRENKRELIQIFMEHIRENCPRIEDKELEDRAQETIVGISEMISYCLIKRISIDIGSPELFKTYERLIEGKDIASIKLIHTSLLIDHKPHFPDSAIVTLAKKFEAENWFAYRILQFLVVQHLYLFDVDRAKKQRVLQALNISYKQLQATDPRRKLLNG